MKGDCMFLCQKRNITNDVFMTFLWNKFILFFVNHLFEGTHFFRIKRFLLRICGLKIGKNTKIVGPIYFAPKAKLIIGHDCWIGKDCSIDGNGKVIIGNRCDIAPHVVFTTGGHQIGDENRRAGKGIINTITIGDGTWIGTRALLLNNIEIKPGCVIAAGSVVIRDQPSNVLIAGVPAQIKKEL